MAAPEETAARDGAAVREETAARDGDAALQRPTTGLGVDIVDVERMRAVTERSPAFVERVFTAGEREYCDGKRKPHVHYATHFAAKEAVAKALGTGFTGGVRPSCIEVVHDENGRPRASLSGRAAELASELGVTELAISLSRTHETAIANAVALTESNRPARPESRPTRDEELTARFKSLKTLLDDIG